MEKIIAQAVLDLFGVDIAVSVSRPDPQFGDYATNVALQLAKTLGRSPREVAEELASKLRELNDFSEVLVAGPGFVNLRVSPKNLANELFAKWTDDFGNSTIGAGKTVLVEFPSPNVAKPYSVGHLRPGNQGWAAKKLMQATGWNVITDNHIGDYGSPFGAWVVGYLKFSSPEALEKDGVYELGRIYIEIKKTLKEEEASGGSDLADQVQEWLIKLESGDQEAVEYSNKFNQISLEHIHSVMKRLGISTDYELGEAFYVQKGKAAVQKLIEEGIATQNPDGSVIVTLEEYGFDVPLLVQKSNGAALYATTDLATMIYRQQEFSPDKVIVAAGAEQQFYFSQLAALAKKIGIKFELIHMWFGVIDQLGEDGTRQKMSSRKGVVLMEELLDKALEKARELVKDRQVSDEDVNKVALGAIKFSDFVADRRTNILFDWDSIFALSGYSGPYVQYAAVRVNKILEATQLGGQSFADYDFESEKQVIAKLLEYPQVVELAASKLEPHKIATYLYELAREMNKYYETTNVLQSEEPAKSARLDVLQKVSKVFEHGLDLLGIEVPGQM